jgi:hypothetical protein
MATLPADEDYARGVLSVFQARGIRPRKSMRVGEVKTAFLSQNMGRAADFDAAIDYAASQGWLSVAFDNIRLASPGDEDYARAVLSIFRARGVRPRQSMRVGEVKAAFLSHNMGRAADFDAAIEYASSHGWLSVAFDYIRLTAPGDEEMHTVPEFRPARPRRIVPMIRALGRGLARSKGLEPPLRLKN